MRTFASQVRNSELGTSHDVSIRKTLDYRDAKGSEKFNGPNASIVNASDDE